MNVASQIGSKPGIMASFNWIPSRGPWAKRLDMEKNMKIRGYAKNMIYSYWVLNIYVSLQELILRRSWWVASQFRSVMNLKPWDWWLSKKKPLELGCDHVSNTNRQISQITNQMNAIAKNHRNFRYVYIYIYNTYYIYIYGSINFFNCGDPHVNLHLQSRKPPLL